MRSRIPPFEIAVPYAVLDDLSARLARTRWPTPIPADDQARHCETRAVRSSIRVEDGRHW
jgi:hypothetical protein